MGSFGLLVQAHPAIAFSAAIWKFPSIGRMKPLEKLGLVSPSTVQQARPGRVLSFPTQVCLLLSFSDKNIHPSFPQVDPVGPASISSSVTAKPSAF